MYIRFPLVSVCSGTNRTATSDRLRRAAHRGCVLRPSCARNELGDTSPWDVVDDTACRPWLEAEIEVIHPHTIVCLGATAAQTLLGRAFRLTHHLGQLIPSTWAESVIATYHPSSILRAPDPADRERMKKQLIRDLRRAAAD